MAAFTAALIGCNKEEGPGGTSILTGNVSVADHENGDHEVTEVYFTPGLEIEHGEYWILNTPEGYTQFYIYYDNPDWVSPANPGLEGRTGLAVSFQYSDSNIEIAMATEEALLAGAGDHFDILRSGDILTITNTKAGYTPDADNVTTPFELNTDQQGQASNIGAFAPAVDEKVYIQYGDKTVYGDVVRTGGSGEYEFTNLTKGNYTVYAISKDTTAIDATVLVEMDVEIADNKSTVTVPEIEILR